MISAENTRESKPYPPQTTGSVPFGIVNARNARSISRARPWGMLATRWRAMFAFLRPWAGGWRQILEHPAARYGLAVGFVLAAIAAAMLIADVTGRFLMFPFYVAVVAATWLGTGPGCLSFILVALAVEDLWTPPLFSLRIGASELPSFIVFVCFTLVCLVWSSQRRARATGARSDCPGADRRSAPQQRRAADRNHRAGGGGATDRAGVARCRGGAGSHPAPGHAGRACRGDRPRDQSAACRDYREWRRLPALPGTPAADARQRARGGRAASLPTATAPAT